MSTSNVFPDKGRALLEYHTKDKNVPMSLYIHSHRGSDVVAAELEQQADVEVSLAGNGKPSGIVDVVTLTFIVYNECI
jgi:hypothetical protein